MSIMSDNTCFNCRSEQFSLCIFDFEYRPKRKYGKEPYLTLLHINLCDFCYQYAADNSFFPLIGHDEYDALDGLVLPEEVCPSESVVSGTTCNACDEETTCTQVPIEHTLLDKDSGAVFPNTFVMSFCETCVERVKDEDFRNVVCTDLDDLVDNHIAKLF
jgi:hypothetical protein